MADGLSKVTGKVDSVFGCWDGDAAVVEVVGEGDDERDGG